MRFFHWPVFTLLLLANSSFAYTLTATSNGQNVRWRYGQKLFLAGNPGGRDSYDPNLFWNAVVNGLQQWKWATNSEADFDYWQGTDQNTYSTGTAQNGLSNIFFASNSSVIHDPNVIGYTQVTYNNDTGNISEVHIMLNDMNFQLTPNITDTTSVTVPNIARPRVYLNNIVTHELGHAFGLSHSGNVNSSMLFVEFPEQAKIACDDWAGIVQLYPHQSSGIGQLNGTILSPQGEPVSGAQVVAISQSRGIPIATALTDQSGNYHFGALPAGEFALAVQPFQGPASTIPSALQAKAISFCGTSSYPTNFVTETDGHTFKKFLVSTNQTTQAGSFNLQCGSITASTSTFDQAATDLFVDTLPAGSTRTYTLEANGPFTLTGVSYLLLSPIKVSLSVTDASGNPISLASQTPLYQSSSKFVIPDTQVSGTAQGTIYVTVASTAQKAGVYPPAFTAAATSYFALVSNLNAVNRSPDSTPLPNNARCAGPDTFAAYQSPPGDPVRLSSGSTGGGGVGFCGSAQAQSFEKNSQTKAVHPSLGSIIGWFFPFLVLFVSQLFSKLRHARLNEE